ncbi:MAG: hypothetical protein HY951_18275 [Bacteroidia bacterium]|nr:hypothetical protein [Bacteroidia bacterium]
MKRLFYILIIFSITVSFTTGDNEIVLELNAKNIYNNGFNNLKPLSHKKIQLLATQFDNVSGWDNDKYMFFSYPLDTVGKDYSLKRKQYIDKFIKRTKFFNFPIKFASQNLNCFLTTITDSSGVFYNRGLKVFFYNCKNPNTSPILILRFADSKDGFTNFEMDSNCEFYSNQEIVSISISTFDILDQIIEGETENSVTPDTVIVKMKISDKAIMDILSEYDSRYNRQK